MSERIAAPEKHEILSSGEHELLTARAKPEKHHVRHNPHEKAQHARETIKHETEVQSNPLERLKASQEASQPATNLNVNRELRQITLRRELKNIRRKLPAPQKALSKVIHQPVIRATSEFTGKTVSRPSGLLGGGIVALIGTSAYLYLAKHVGFEYNYGVFLVLFVGGFALGLLVELGVHLIMSSRRKANN